MLAAIRARACRQ